MSKIDYDLTSIKAFIFDIDGVLSSDTVPLHPNGEPMRMINIKDGYALQLAVKKGYTVAILSGARTHALRLRFEALGIPHIMLGSQVKILDFNKFLEKTALHPNEIMYMGDDIPDYEVMEQVGLPACPANAAPEIKSISKYVSPYNGGYGCARDVIEQVMKVNGDWFTDEAFGW